MAEAESAVADVLDVDAAEVDVECAGNSRRLRAQRRLASTELTLEYSVAGLTASDVAVIEAVNATKFAQDLEDSIVAVVASVLEITNVTVKASSVTAVQVDGGRNGGDGDGGDGGDGGSEGETGRSGTATKNNASGKGVFLAIMSSVAVCLSM